MAILMLVDEGKLTLETTLGELYPEANDYAKGITIQQILRHQSGLPDYEPLVPADGEQAHDADVLRLMLEAEEGYFEPGTEYRYSNSGYAVLAMIVEKLSGQSFAEFLDARIFTPLGMDGTVAFEKGISTVGNRAYGYAVTDAGVEFADQSAWSAVLGDGGVYSSLDDLYTWDQALYRDDLLSPELKRGMFEPSLENYGYGWRIDEYGGSLRQHHSGSTSGFRNFIMRLPEASLTVIVLTNRAEPDVRELAEKVADLYL
jgi:CubicO group peptidase (beta-lactamase class C family)